MAIGTQVFGGTWIVSVLSKSADFSERFVIEGATTGNGIFAGDVTTPPVTVSGPQWTLRFEWNNNVGSGWQPSDIRRTAASYSLQNGLTTVLNADDNFPNLRDGDFNDLVLACHDVDPAFNPGIPLTPPDFTFPPGGPGGGGGGGGGGSGSGSSSGSSSGASHAAVAPPPTLRTGPR